MKNIFYTIIKFTFIMVLPLASVIICDSIFELILERLKCPSTLCGFISIIKFPIIIDIAASLVFSINFIWPIAKDVFKAIFVSLPTFFVFMGRSVTSLSGIQDDMGAMQLLCCLFLPIGIVLLSAITFFNWFGTYVFKKRKAIK